MIGIRGDHVLHELLDLTVERGVLRHRLLDLRVRPARGDDIAGLADPSPIFVELRIEGLVILDVLGVDDGLAVFREARLDLFGLIALEGVVGV